MKNFSAVRKILESNHDRFNRPSFIPGDPVSVPHRFSKKQDIEISAFFSAVLSWGLRTNIVNSANRLMQLMDEAPYEFITRHSQSDLKKLTSFVHRTFNGTDLLHLIAFLRHHYSAHSSLETAFFSNAVRRMPLHGQADAALRSFHHYCFSIPHTPQRTRKHIPTPEKNSACKRLNMFLRWMVRRDDRGVDFGLWKSVSSAALLCPLDVHVQRVALSLGLLNRGIPDRQAVHELTQSLRIFDSSDPVKYDFALFGIGLTGKL